MVRGRKLAIDLYKVNDFPVVVGDETSAAALCTLWQDPFRLAGMERERFALIGSLRSPFGINLLLYNLARNPWIRELIVWGPDKLSNTSIGLVGKRALLALWENGVDAAGKVVGNGYALLPEVDPQVVNTIVRNVRLRDLSELKALPPGAASDEPARPYMEPVYFPEFVVVAPRVWPSEGLAVPVRQRTGAQAFLRLLERVWRYGSETPIDTGGEAVKELRAPVVVVEAENYDDIEVPPWLAQLPELGISREALESYARSQFSPEPYLREIFPGVRRFDRAAPGSYLYAELLFAFPRPAEVDAAARALLEAAGYHAAAAYVRSQARVDPERAASLLASVEESELAPGERLAVLLEGLFPPTDQVANVIDRLRRKPDDLDKECVLWDARYHSTLESGRPCLMKLSFSLRAGKVDVLAFFRSHDVFGAWFYNYYGIASLLKRITAAAGVQPGRIVVQSESAHIYARHWTTVERLLKAELEEKPARMFFDAELDADPRGNVSITLVDGSINLKLMTPRGDGLVLELAARNARELLYRLRHLDPFSRLDHAAFVGAEVARAEVALRLGIPYEQDKGLSLTAKE